MNQILIEACVQSSPDGSNQARVRKAILDEDGRLLAKYFLTHYGEWKEVLPSEYVPDECLIKASVQEIAPVKDGHYVVS